MFGLSPSPHTISVHDAHTRIEENGHCLLDVRTIEEVSETGIPGSLNIPLDRLGSEAHRLSTYTSIHVICRSGGRSAMATNILHSLGMTHAKNVDGGIIAWSNANLPLV